ncbi:hypothetical protein GQ600_20305 [Phytophthora cactorum]|nr:hypothetical protein GQ600_20305 [Phytophthora cactorum]
MGACCQTRRASAKFEPERLQPRLKGMEIVRLQATGRVRARSRPRKQRWKAAISQSDRA